MNASENKTRLKIETKMHLKITILFFWKFQISYWQEKEREGTHLKRKVIDLLAYYKHIKLNRTTVTTGRPVLEKTADQNMKFTICDIINRKCCAILNREYFYLWESSAVDKWHFAAVLLVKTNDQNVSLSRL